MPSTTINGYEHYWEDVGSGEPLVMVHEALQSSRIFAEQIEELSTTFRVVAPDLRGMGRSARVASMPPSAWIDDLLALLDHLGIESAHFYASSIGARAVLRLALGQPSRVRSMVLNNPIVALETSGDQTLNERMSDPFSLPPRIQELQLAMHGEDWPDAVRNFFAIRNDPALQQHLNVRGEVERLTVPTLLTRGDNRRDRIHPIEHVFELFLAIPTARMWVKPEGGCFATPQGYEVVRRFIAEATETRDSGAAGA